MFKSKGLKRNLAALLAAVAAAAQFIPALQPFQELLISVSGALGALGLGHAAIEGNLVSEK